MFMIKTIQGTSSVDDKENFVWSAHLTPAPHIPPKATVSGLENRIPEP